MGWGAEVEGTPHGQVPDLRQRFEYFRRGSKDAKLLQVLARSEADAFLRDGTAMVFCDGAASPGR
jgi:hypothetical protein